MDWIPSSRPAASTSLENKSRKSWSAVTCAAVVIVSGQSVFTIRNTVSRDAMLSTSRSTAAPVSSPGTPSKPASVIRGDIRALPAPLAPANGMEAMPTASAM